MPASPAEQKSVGDKADSTFGKADPTFVRKCTALDRSRIPATPDFLLSEPVGFGISLKRGRASGWNPSMAVGEDHGAVSYMNYGRAIHEFGAPDGPGLGWRESGHEDGEDTVLSNSRDSAEGEQDLLGTAEEALSQMRVTTEEELRSSRDPEYKNKSVLTPAEQWALFHSSKFMPDATNLAAQYAKLVAEKEQRQAAAAQAKPNTIQTGPAAPTSVPTLPDDPNAWPEVDDLTFAGFTNWIIACKARQKKFGSKTCDPWREERLARETSIKERLAAWSKSPASKALKSEIKDPHPSTFWPYPEMLGEVDCRELGIIPKKSKAKRKE